MIKKFLHTVVLTLLLTKISLLSLFSQIDIDSLKLVLSQVDEENKAPIFLRLSEEYRMSSQEKSLKYAHKALSNAIKFENNSNIALAYKTIGVYHYQYSHHDSAIHYNLLALEKYQQINDEPGMGKSFNNLGIFYSNIGLYTKSIEYHLQSLEIKEKLKDSTGLSYSYNNIGTLYYVFKNYDLALNYFSKSLNLAIRLNDDRGHQSALSNIGLIFTEQQNYSEAIKAFDEALEICHKLNDIRGISTNLQNLGKALFHQNKFNQALEYFLRCQNLNTSYSIQSPSNLNSLGQTYDELQNYQQALYYFEKAYTTAVETGDINNQMLTCQNLALLYKHFKDYDQAWTYLNESHSLSDFINKEIYSKQIAEFQVRSNIEKRNAAKSPDNKHLSAKGLSQDIFSFITNRILIYSLLSLLILMLIFILIRKNKKPPLHVPSNNESKLSQRLREIINASTEAIFFVDGMDIVREANQSFKKLFELQDNNIIGKSKNELIKLKPELSAPINKFFASNHEAWEIKRPVREIINIENTNGPDRILEIEKTPVFNSDNSKNGIISICRDIAPVAAPQDIKSQTQENELPDLRNIINQLFDIVIYTDGEGTCTDAIINKPELLYNSGDKIIRGSKIDDGIFPPEIGNEILEIYNQVVKNGNGRIFGYNHHINNEDIEIELQIRSITANQIVLLIRKKNIEVLRSIAESDVDFESILRISPNACILVGSDGEVIRANDAGSKLLGYSDTDQICGTRFINFLSKHETVRDLNEIVDQAVKGKSKKLLIKTKQGTEFYAEITSHSIKHDENSDSYFISIRDVSPLIKLEEDLKHAYKKVQESDKIKTFFLANMSHEIRTPMNSIIGFSNLLADEGISEEQRMVYVRNINNSSNSLLHLIEDIIDVSKIESGQISLNEEICYLNEIFSEFYGNYSDLYELELQTSIEFKIRLGSKDADFAILTDVFRFKQIMSNIISNAFKYTQKGYIEIGYLLPDNEMIEFYVKDTGIGISKEKQELIFDRFNLADESATRVFGGAGLGLTISKSLINLMGGTIYVDSKEGKGSSFHFTLPYKPVIHDENGVSDYDMPPGKTYNFEGKKILIAEDVEPNYQLIKSFLRKTKADLIWAKDGKEAVELCKKQKVDIVVMDIQMPVKNGFEAMKEIKEFNKELPIIAQTAYAMVDDRPKILADGFDEYISKPLKVSIFLSILDRFLK